MFCSLSFLGSLWASLDGDDLLKLANEGAYFDLGELVVFGED